MHAEEYDFSSPAARWVTVFTGPFAKVISLRSLLESEGVLTWVPDETMKTFDPFITGANPLGVELQVPETDVERVHALLADMRSSGEAAGAAPSAAEDATTLVERQGTVVRWCFVFLLAGWIFGVFAGLSYWNAARRLETPPAGHRVTVTLWLLQIALLVATFSVPLTGLTPR